MHISIFSILLLLVSLPVMGQQEESIEKDPQNIKVEPENTDCHKLPESFSSLSEALTAIEQTRFYYDESIKTTRKSGLMRARFMSCDFKAGFLWIHYDGEDQLYPAVDLDLWEQFQGTADIDGFYFNNIQNLPMIESP